MKTRAILRIESFAAVVCLFCASCRDQDFDWEEHYRDNVEYQYQEIIKSIFGQISPDQSWDFSGFSAAETVVEENIGGTRAVPSDDYTSLANRDGKDIYVNNQTDDGWFLVPTDLISWFKRELPEKNKNAAGVEGEGTNPSKGQTFVLKVPKHGFKITPIYTGNSLIWDLYIQAVDKDLKPVGNPYNVWSKGTRMQRKVNNGNWSDCGIYTRTDENNVTAIRTKTIEIEDGFFEPGTTVMLYLQITANRRYTEAPLVCDPTKTREEDYYERNNRGQNVYKGKRLVDQPVSPIGQQLWSNKQMLAMKVPEPLISDRLTINVGGQIFKNDVIIVGCEDNNVPDKLVGKYVTRKNMQNMGGEGTSYGNDISEQTIQLSKADWDYNDLVLMIEGYGLQTIPIKYREYTSKRYMVEDLGYDSQKKINKTDIDFNDIVVDIVDRSSGVEYEKDLNGNEVEGSRKPFTDDSGKTEVTVWALGGVFDFTLYTYTDTNPSNNRKQVFKKSQTSAGDFNSYYVVDGKNITGLTTTTMYNTSRTWPNCDGNFDGNNYIWRKEFNKSDISWDSQKNNLVFVVADNYIHKDYTSTPVQETTITFPANGDTHPQIIAFPIGTMWNEEREGIDQRWPLGGTFQNRQ